MGTDVRKRTVEGDYFWLMKDWLFAHYKFLVVLIKLKQVLRKLIKLRKFFTHNIFSAVFIKLRKFFTHCLSKEEFIKLRKFFATCLLIVVLIKLRKCLMTDDLMDYILSGYKLYETRVKQEKMVKSWPKFKIKLYLCSEFVMILVNT